MNPAAHAFIRGLHNLRPWHRGCVATIGSFDGVHLGHQAILRQLIDVSRYYNLPAVVIVFEPQPHEFFSGDKAPARLMRLREKVQALLAAGVARVLCVQFNQALRNLTAEEFIEKSCWMVWPSNIWWWAMTSGLAVIAGVILRCCKTLGVSAVLV